MDKLINRIICSIFDINTLYLIFVCILSLLFFKIFDIIHQLWIFKKIKNNIINKIEEEFCYKKILSETESFIMKEISYESIKDFVDNYSQSLKKLNTKLDIIWYNTTVSYTYKSGLSKRTSDILITEILRNITFKYWQISDIFELVNPSNLNKKEIINNLSGYANEDVKKIIKFIKIDQSFQNELKENIGNKFDKKHIDKRIWGKEEKLLVKELCSL